MIEHLIYKSIESMIVIYEMLNIGDLGNRAD